MKKFIAVFTVLAILLVAGSIKGESSTVSAEGLTEFVGRVYHQLDDKGNKLNGSDYMPSTLILETSDISNKIVIKGSTGEVPFNIEGELTKAEFPGKLIGELTDTTDRFEVIYFGIEKKSNDNISILNPESTSVAVKLYLLDKTNRDFYVYETSSFELFDLNQDAIFSTADNLNPTSHLSEFWYGKLITPEFETVENPQLHSVVSGSSSVTHTVSYPILGHTVKEDVTLKAIIEGPTVLSSDGSTFSTKFKFVSERTYSSSLPSANSSQTNFKIGSMNPTKIEAYTEPGDIFRWIQWDGSYTNGGSISLKIGASYGLPGTPISFSTAYNSTKNVTSHSLMNYENDGTNKARKAKAEWAKGKMLQNEGQFFDANFKVANYNTPKQKKLTVRFTYDVFNAQNYQAIGQQTKNMSFSYGSK